MMKIAICEDKKEDQLRLKDLLMQTKLLRESSNFVFFDNGKDITNDYCKGNRFDIVFLDIDMPEVDGIEAGTYIHSLDRNAIIIFVTSYPQYALEAFDCNPFHYLIKPIDYEKFFNVVLKAMNHHKGIHHEYIVKPKVGEIVRLNVSDIYYIECCRKHIIYHTKQNVYETKDTLTAVLHKLEKYGFYQVHQGYIVNFARVSKFQQDCFVMSNGEKVMVSIRKRAETISAYTNYMERYL